MQSILEFTDLLQVEGVNFKGFGVIPKYVMIDPDLTIEAKTIYAYFCSFAGAGNTAFPSRDKITVDLPMNKDTFYKHFKLLTEQGYITIQQTRAEKAKFSKNIYSLISNPKKFEDQSNNAGNNKSYSKIRFSGLKSVGYGLIPKAVMIDPRLPVKSKGIYAYFCSFTGSGNNAFPKKNIIIAHLKINESTYYKFYKILTELNYIKAVQRNIVGSFSVNDYYLIDNPNENNVTEKIIINESPYTESSDTVKPYTESSDTVNQDTIINSFKSNNLKNNNLIISNQDEKSEKEKSDRIRLEKLNYINSLKELFEYDYYAEYSKDMSVPVEHRINCDSMKKFMDQVIEIMSDVHVRADEEKIVISGRERYVWEIKERLEKIDFSALEYVKESIEKNNTVISKVDKYLLASLFNAPATIDSYYQNRVNVSFNK